MNRETFRGGYGHFQIWETQDGRFIVRDSQRGEDLRMVFEFGSALWLAKAFYEQHKEESRAA